MTAQLQDFFKSCELDGSRCVDLESFRDLCNRLNISSRDADLIFDDLDLDRDGRISFADFSKGFSDYLQQAQTANEGVQDEAVRNSVWSTLTTEAEKVGHKTSDEAKLRWLLGELQASEQRHLVPLLEGAVEELLSSLRQLQEEKSRLEESWRREKLEHQRHLKRMEEELDSQVKEVEMRMRMKAQEEVEGERKSLQSKMDTELNKLAAIEKVFAWFRTQCPPQPGEDSRLEEVRSKLGEAVYDNHQLRMSLLDTQTSIALMRSELLQLRTLYEEKCRELSSEKEKILEVLQEQDHLSRQLNLLHDANRRLLDSHDALKNSVECSFRQGNTLSRAKSGSIIGDYLDLNYSRDCLDRCLEQDDAEDEEDTEVEDRSRLRRAQSTDTLDAPPVIRRREKTQAGRNPSLNHSDSGVSSTVRDSFGPSDHPWEDEEDDVRPASPEKRKVSVANSDDIAGRNRSNSRRGSRVGRNGSVPPPEDRKILHQHSSSRSRLRSSASEDSLLVENDFSMPRRRISDIKKQLGIKDDGPPANWRRSWAPRQCSTPKDSAISCIPPKPLPRLSKKLRDDRTTPFKESSVNSDEEGEVLEVDESSVEEFFEPDGPPERTFRVIFVGDAGVGKSSFALRVSKGVFVRHMSSTLGLDFLMRTLRVDGRNVAVQLWDTAGQERFRSITKSYFRKADGVMLLYDCTCEQSFLDVRQWVEDIDVVCFYNMMAEKPIPGRKASFHRIPLMIVANKIDLREMALKTGITCVTTEQGEKLAKDCDTTFMETSAKDGSNVLPAMANLIRSMSTQQDLKMSASTMQLCETKPKKSGCCGGK